MVLSGSILRFCGFFSRPWATGDDRAPRSGDLRVFAGCAPPTYSSRCGERKLVGGELVRLVGELLRRDGDLLRRDLARNDGHVDLFRLALAGDENGRARLERAADVREYIFSRAAYERLETLDCLHLWIGFAAGGVKGRHKDRFMQAEALAWQIGRSLGVLDVLGEMPS